MKKSISVLFIVVLLLGLLTVAASATGFNASFDLEERQDGNTIIVTIQDIPAGQTPTLSVPCGENWTQATVTKGGIAIQGKVSFEYDEDIGANYVNFTVTEGGTYVITNTTPALMYKSCWMDNGNFTENSNIQTSMTGTPGYSTDLRFFFGTSSDLDNALEVAPKDVVFIPDGSSEPSTNGEITVSVPSWASSTPNVLRIQFNQFCSGTLRVTADGETYEMPFATIVPDNGYFASKNDYGEATYLANNSSYTPGQVIYLVENSSRMYIPENCNFTVQQGGEYITARLVDTGKTITLNNGSVVNRYAVEVTIKNNCVGDIDFQIQVPRATVDGDVRNNSYWLSLSDPNYQPPAPDSEALGPVLLGTVTEDGKQYGYYLGLGVWNDMQNRFDAAMFYVVNPSATNPTQSDVLDTRYPVVFRQPMTGGLGGIEEIEIKETLTAAITSVAVSSDKHDTATATVTQNGAHGKFPVSVTGHTAVGKATISVAVAFDTSVQDEITLPEQAETKMSYTVLRDEGQVSVTVEKGSALAAQISTADGFNAYLAEQAENSSVFTLTLYEDFEISGTIVVPAGVKIEGNGATIYGNMRLTIHGNDGVDPQGESIFLHGINLICPNQQEYPTAIAPGPSAPDWGVYLNLHNCLIEGYVTGIDTNDGSEDGCDIYTHFVKSTFRNNHTALDLKSRLHSDSHYGNIFEGNNVAIRVGKGTELLLSSQTVFNSVFQQNATNVINETDIDFYMPNCLYKNGSGKIVKPNSGKFKTTGKGEIFYTPYYYEEQEGMFEYNYRGQTITGGNKELKMQQGTTEDIHAGELEDSAKNGKVTIEIKSGDEGLYEWEISEAVQPMRMMMFSRMRMMSAAPEELPEEELDIQAGDSFNPMVGIKTEDDVTTVTVGDFEFTEGAINAMLTIPFEGTGVLNINYKGQKYEGELNGGFATFQVIGSGEYQLSIGDHISNYTVTFDAKGGSAIQTQTIAQGELVVKPDDPAQAGYSFVGWYTDEACTTAYDFSAEVTASFTLYAKWEKITVEPTPNPDPGPSVTPEAPAPDAGETDAPSVDTDAPVVDSTTTENEDGSTVKTETLENGAVVETVTKPDGSTTSTATKTETVETEAGKTTTTVTTTTQKDASGAEVTESREEVVVETEEGTTVNTTVVIESEEKTEKTVSETKTTVDENGKETTVTTSKTETKAANGSTGTTVMDAEGKVTADVAISEKAVEEAAKAGETVALPMPAVSSTDSTETAPVITVTNPAAEAVTVEIPVAEAGAGTVVVLVHEDGTEEVITKTMQTENGLAVKVDGNVTVKVVDNAKDFNDTENHWANDAIDHASSRELFNGVGEGAFAPDVTMNRAMLATVLWRMEGKQEASAQADFDDLEEGHWSEEAVHWAAENDIINGSNGSFDGEGAVTREQMVTMLYRMSGSPEVAEEDAVEGASDWAANAVAWAVKIGLMKGDGAGLNLQGTATRAQIATFLMRFMNMKF